MSVWRRNCSLLLVVVFLVTLLPVTWAEGNESVSIACAADSYIVRNYVDNHGTEETLLVRGNDYRTSYLKFPLSSLTGHIASAQLEVYSADKNTGLTVRVAVAEHSNWEETEIDGKSGNRPDYGYSIDNLGLSSAVIPGKANTKLTFAIPGQEIEKAMQAAAEAGEPPYITLVLYVNDSESPTFSIHSKDASDANAMYRPVLVVETYSELTDDIAVTKDADALSLPAMNALTVGTIDLPLSGENGSTISWESDNACIRIEGGTGYINRPSRNEKNAQVTLTATVRKGDAQPQTKAFTALVLSNRHPMEDTYVKGYSPANFNYGISANMIVRTNTYGIQYSNAYLKFDLSDLGPDSNTYIESAVLRLTADRDFANADVTSQRVAFVPDDNWKAGALDGVDITGDGVDSEKIGITANTKPTYYVLEPERSATCSTSGGGVLAGDIYEFDVLDLVRQEAAGDGTLSLAVYSTDTTDSQYQYYSNEASMGRPELLLDVEIADQVPPGEVTEPNVFPQDGALRLVWTDPSDADFAQVRIYDQDGEALETVAKTTQNYFVSGLANGETYRFLLTTVDKFGNESEGIEISGTPNPVQPDIVAPAAVTALTAETGDGQILLRWVDPADIDLQRIVVKFDGQTLYAPKGAQQLLVTGLANNAYFTFDVQAEDFSGNLSDTASVTQKTTEPYKMMLDSFDGSTIFSNNVELVEEPGPDGSSGYGSFSLEYSATYKRASLNGADIAEFGATGLQFYAKCNTALSDPMLFAMELRESGGQKNYQVQLGSQLNGTDWTLLYVPFSAFERTGGSAAIDFEPLDPSAVTEVRLLSYGLASDGLEKIDIDIDAFAAIAVVDEPKNVTDCWADGRVVLSFDSNHAVNIYQDGVLLNTIPKEEKTDQIDGLTNGEPYQFTLKSVDAKGRESSGVTVSGTPQVKDIQLARALVKYPDGTPVQALGAKETVILDTQVVTDEETGLRLSYAFYDSVGNLAGIEHRLVSVQAGESWGERIETTVPNGAVYGKVFLWKTENMAPVIPGRVFPASQDTAFAVSTYFADGMVLQRNKPITVWGTAPVGAEVAVTFGGKTANTVSLNGCWEAVLPAMPANADGSVLTVACNGEIKQFTDVLVGDVYLASGQSNMYFKVIQSENGNAVMDAATDEGIRVFYHEITSVPERKSMPTNAKWFPAVGAEASRNLVYATPFFYAQEMRKQYPEIPIGIVQSAYNGSYMEAWLSDAALKTLDPSTLNANTAYVKTRWSGLFNGCIAPVAKAEYAAILWYQGESNKSLGYVEKLSALIADWRDALDSPDLPFLFVNLPAYGQEGADSDYAIKREKQYEVWRDVPNTGMIVAMEWGDRYDIHPTKKQPIGMLWSLVARHMLFGEDIEYSGPVYESYEVIGNAMYLSFTHDDGLTAAGGDPLSGFELCGPDGIYVKATAVIEDGRVKLTAEGVDTPVNARYAWADTPDIIDYTACEEQDGSFILTYDAISPRYQIGDSVEGFRIMRGDSAVIKAKAVVLENNQVQITYPGDASYQAGDRPVYSFLDFPFKAVNLTNSAGLSAVPFRTGE